MLEPKYNINNKILFNIKKIAELSVDLNNRNYSQVVLVRLLKNAKEISVFSSTSIEGNPLPLSEVKKILKNKPQYIRDTEKEVLNYNQALTDLNKRIDQKKINFNLSLVLNIQKLVMQDLIQDYRCGKFRIEPVFVNNPKTGRTVYWPPDHQDVLNLLQDLIDYINDNKNKIDPLILAGIFHKQFVIIHPFMDGNGRTVRLVTKVLLANMGLNTFNLFSFENYYNKNIDKYFNKVGEINNYYDIKNKIDFTAWLEYFTDGIIDELLRVGKEVVKQDIKPKDQLSNDQQKLINYIKRHGYITDKLYSEITDRAKPTRHLDFRNLIERGLIEMHNKARATYYKLKTE
ncbi:MAG: Fic family protein [Parcubacteria group bacterium]|nr:Fic family protein [Parcubacteria group bacterium]